MLFTLTLFPPSGPGLQAQPTPSQGKLHLPDLIFAGFTNGQRAQVIVNLFPPPRALPPTDWNSPQSLQSLHAANHGAQEAVLSTLTADEHKVHYRFDNQPGFSCELTPGALQKLLSNPQVALIEPVQEMKPHLAQGLPLMNALSTRSTYDGSDLSIAICDTGIDYNHPRLGGGGFPNSKVIGGYDFGDSDADPIPNTQAHGTCCAGIAAGDLGTVGSYIGGVAPAARLYACKITSGTGGSATSAAMAAAWDWCVTHKNDDPAHPIVVISTSFGGGQYFSTCDTTYSAMTTAANNAVAAGITVLASSGNDGFCDSIGWPACITSVISVGAVYDASFGTYLPCISSASCAPKTSTTGCSTGYYATDSTAADKVTSYANVASFLDLFAPGNQCYTTDITGASGYSTGDYYDSFGGTSAACPYAAGAVACLQHAAKARTGAYLTPSQVRSRMAAAGDLVTDTKVAITKPRVNLGNAINAIVPVVTIVLDSTTLVTEGCPPANGAIDPNETVGVSFALKNVGGGSTSNLVATLLATGGVTAPSSAQSYGVVTGGGAAVSRTFTFTATGTCGGVLKAVLQLQDGTNNMGLVTNTFTLGTPGSPTTVNYSSGGLSTAIANNSSIDIPITVADSSLVAGVDVRVRLNHTRDSDLVLSLIHPDGTVVTLANKRGGSGDNYGSGATDCTGTFTIFDDSAATSITSGSAPFAGSYQPEQPLSALNGKTAAGTWRLRVADTAFAQTGTFYCFQLDLTSQVYACCTGTGAELTVGMTAAPAPVIVGSNLTYSLTVTNLGPVTASSVTLTDALPAGVVFVSGNVSQGTWATNGGGLFTCALGDINSGSNAAVSVVVKTGSSGSLTNTVTVASTTADPNTANNSKTTVTAVNDLPPSVTQSPQPQNVCPGGTAGFSVAATGAGTLSYQWQKNSVNLTNGGHYSGVTTSNLTVAAVDATVLGNYRCVVSNQGGSTPSSAAALTMNDTTPPTIVCPPDVTVSATSGCSATNVALGSPVTGDNCAVAAVTNNAPGLYPLGTNVVIWKVTDTSGNTNTCAQLVIVQDTTPPTLTCATNKTVECGSAWSFDIPAAADACSGTNVTVSILSTVTNGMSPEIITRTWSAVDAAGNSNTCSQVVTVVDTTPPVLTCATNKTVECGNAWSFDIPAAADACSGTNVTVSILSTVTNGTSPELITRTWSAVDPVGNSNTCSQVVTVVDTTPPVLTCATNKTVACASAWSFDAPTAADACSGTNVTVNILSTVTNAAWPETITRTWSATDAAGNTNTCSQVVTLISTNPPVLNCATNKTVECGSAWGFNAPTAFDACGGTNVTVSVLNTVTNGTTPETITRTWSAVDPAGNSNSCSQVVTVVDTTPPLLTCATNKTVLCSSAWSFDLPVASDACSGTNVTVTLVAVQTNGGNLEMLTATWVATDASGNTNMCSQVVTLASLPTVVNNPASQVLAAGGTATFSITATNECGSGPTYQWRWNGNDIAGATGSTYTRTNAQCGDAGSFDVVVATLAGSQTSAVASLEVMAPPAILSAPADQSLAVGQDATFCISATNDCGGQITYQWRFQGEAIPGATTTCYSLAGIRAANVGSYDVVVTNFAGAVTSLASALTVSGPYLTPYDVEGTNFLVVFQTVSGMQYVVEYKDVVTDTNLWLPLVTNEGTGGLLTNDIPMTNGLSGRFYRVLVP